jgi:transglutaminase-like putative cysteine protease
VLPAAAEILKPALSMKAPSQPLDITVRVGSRQTYDASAPTPSLLIIKPHRSCTQEVTQERFTVIPGKTGEEFQDENGNTVYRFNFPPGKTTIEHDALVNVSSQPDNHGLTPRYQSLSEVPTSTLRYTFPTRYCDSDKLVKLAQKQFGKIPRGIKLIQAICDWTHRKIEYRKGNTSTTSASGIIEQRWGVCKDFAHVAISLCRCFELPTRYVSGHLANIGRKTTEPRMDFHAYFEVYLGAWFTFDARFNVPRRGRIKVAHGLDASDTQISTGEMKLKDFEVWAYQVDPKEVFVGDPVDLSKRLDGTLKLRHQS